MIEPPLSLDHSLFSRLQFGVVTAVKYAQDDSGQETTQFSGWIGVTLITESHRFEWVKWSNPLMGNFNNGYGVVAVPAINDIVVIDFDIRHQPVVVGMALFEQAGRPIGVQKLVNPQEVADPRINLKPGELMIRGSNKSSIKFQADGSTVFRLDDTKQDTDTTVLKIDPEGNISVTKAKAVTVQCESTEVDCSGNATVKCQTAEVDCTTAKIVSDDIHLGKTGAEEPIIRNQDFSTHIDPITGLPVTTFMYQSNSGSVKST